MIRGCARIRRRQRARYEACLDTGNQLQVSFNLHAWLCEVVEQEAAWCWDSVQASQADRRKGYRQAYARLLSLRLGQVFDSMIVFHRCRMRKAGRQQYYSLLVNAVDDGIAWGWARAHKHVRNPARSTLLENMELCIINSLSTIIDLENSAVAGRA